MSYNRGMFKPIRARPNFRINHFNQPANNIVATPANPSVYIITPAGSNVSYPVQHEEYNNMVAGYYQPALPNTLK